MKYAKRKDGRYSTSITNGYKEDGRPNRITIYGKSCAEVDRKKAELLKGFSEGIKQQTATSLYEYGGSVLKAIKSRVGVATQQKYTAAFNRLRPLWELPLAEVKQSQIVAIVNAEAKHPDNARMIKQTVRAIYSQAIADGITSRNIADGIRITTVKSEKHRALTEAERQAIDRADFTEDEKAAVLTMLYTGCRTEELLALRYEDYKDGCICINKALTWKGGKRIKETKTENGERLVPVPSVWQTMAEERKGLIVSGPDGSLISQSGWRRMWCRILTKINKQLGGGVIRYTKAGKVEAEDRRTDLTPYDFRHNYATALYMNGVDLKTAQKLMGHASIRLTLETYTHAERMDSAKLARLQNLNI